MAGKVLRTSLAMALLAILCAAGASAQQSTCSSPEFNLSSCVDYVKGKASAPSSSCCLGFANLVASVPSCLCTVPNSGGAESVYAINRTRAMTLPGVCKVQLPPVVKCNPEVGSPSPASVPGVPSGSRTQKMQSWAQMSSTVLFSFIFIAGYLSKPYPTV